MSALRSPLLRRDDRPRATTEQGFDDVAPLDGAGAPVHTLLSACGEQVIRGYVGGVRGARRLAAENGLLRWLERRDGRRSRFARSLFAVHDVDDLAALDLAWWTFAALRRIEAFLAARGGGANAFEYGPGASTHWLARRCRRVAAVEHDPAWWSMMSPGFAALPHVAARHVPGSVLAPGARARCPSAQAGWAHLDFSRYVAAIEEAGGPFDLIAIDGRARGACLLAALEHLKPDGLIVFDNVDRRRYRVALAASGLHVARHRGLAPTQWWPSETGLLARDPEVLGLA